MKRTALKRAPFKRAMLRGPAAWTLRVPSIKRKRSKPRRGPMRDQAYMDWLKERRCSLKFSHGCPNSLAGLIVDPCHTIGNGMRSKGPDSSCIPLCRQHHDEMDGRTSTAITTKAQFAAKYSLDLAMEAAAHYALYLIDKESKKMIPVQPRSQQ